MAYALELAFEIPPAWGYLICALVVIPLVTHGVTAISKLQAWTQPLWIFLLVLPYAFLFFEEPQALSALWQYGGEHGRRRQLRPASVRRRRSPSASRWSRRWASRSTTCASCRRKRRPTRRRWWLAVIIGGPGWVVPGVLKMLGGALLAWLVLRNGIAGRKGRRPQPDVPDRLFARLRQHDAGRSPRRRCSSSFRSSRSM